MSENGVWLCQCGKVDQARKATGEPVKRWTCQECRTYLSQPVKMTPEQELKFQRDERHRERMRLRKINNALHMVAVRKQQQAEGKNDRY